MYHFNYLLSNLVYSTMSHYGYLPHEYIYALLLADHYDLYPWDSMIHNKVSKRYPMDEDEDASACDSASDEDEDSGDEEVLTTSANVLENSASFDGIVFDSFKSPIVSVSTPSIEPKFDGFSTKIGEISCVIIHPCCNIIAEDDSVFIDSQEDKKLQVLEPELNFIVSKVSEEFVIHVAPVRLRSTVYDVTAVRPFALRLFVGKQAEQLFFAVNNQIRVFELHENQSSFSIPTEDLVCVHCSSFSKLSNKSDSVCGGYLGIEERKALFLFDSTHTLQKLGFLAAFCVPIQLLDRSRTQNASLGFLSAHQFQFYIFRSENFPSHLEKHFLIIAFTDSFILSTFLEKPFLDSNFGGVWFLSTS